MQLSIRILEGEAYTDIVKIRREDRIKQAKRDIGKAWVPTNSTKLPSGMGSFFGCFNGRVDAFSAAMKAKEKYKAPNKNLYTNPSKQGTGYGYLNVTIGKYPKYTSEPYDRSKELRQKEISTDIKLRKAGVFKLSANGKDFFDDNPFHSKKPLPPNKEPSGSSKSKHKPFVPSSPSKLTGGCLAGTFTKYPEHSVDPYIPRHKVGAQSKGPKRKFVGGVFKPSPCPKSMPMNSVVTQNIHRSTNSSNYLTATA